MYSWCLLQVYQDRHFTHPSVGPHSIALSFATDGFQPFQRSVTSVWPLLLMICNLPSNIRFKREYMMLCGLIPGHPSTLQPFLKPLVMDLNTLYNEGFKTYCAACKTDVLVRVKLLFTTADYPANCLLTSQQQQGPYRLLKYQSNMPFVFVLYWLLTNFITCISCLCAVSKVLNMVVSNVASRDYIARSTRRSNIRLVNNQSLNGYCVHIRNTSGKEL